MKVLKAVTKLSIFCFVTKLTSVVQFIFYQSYSYIMFRNTYLEAYKTASLSKPDIHNILLHFTHLYTTLGCALQDIEFQIGKMLIEQPKNQSQPNRVEQLPYLKSKVDREVIKIEQSLRQNDWNDKPQKITQIKNVQVPKEENVDLPSKKTDNSSKSNQNYQSNEQKSKNNQFAHLEIPRNDVLPNNISTASFDDLFYDNSRYEAHRPSEKMAIIPQISQENENSPNLNYGDQFLDQLFQKQEKKKKK